MVDSHDQKGRLLTAQDVANKLSCSLRQVLRLRASGRLPDPIKIGRLVRWDQRSIDGFIASECAQIAGVRQQDAQGNRLPDLIIQSPNPNNS